MGSLIPMAQRRVFNLGIGMAMLLMTACSTSGNSSHGAAGTLRRSRRSAAQVDGCGGKGELAPAALVEAPWDPAALAQLLGIRRRLWWKLFGSGGALAAAPWDPAAGSGGSSLGASGGSGGNAPDASALGRTLRASWGNAGGWRSAGDAKSDLATYARRKQAISALATHLLEVRQEVCARASVQ